MVNLPPMVRLVLSIMCIIILFYLKIPLMVLLIVNFYMKTKKPKMFGGVGDNPPPQIPLINTYDAY